MTDHSPQRVFTLEIESPRIPVQWSWCLFRLCSIAIGRLLSWLNALWCPWREPISFCMKWHRNAILSNRFDKSSRSQNNRGRRLLKSFNAATTAQRQTIWEYRFDNPHYFFRYVSPANIPLLCLFLRGCVGPTSWPWMGWSQSLHAVRRLCDWK